MFSYRKNARHRLGGPPASNRLQASVFGYLVFSAELYAGVSTASGKLASSAAIA
jgi:hypothetical protein